MAWFNLFTCKQVNALSNFIQLWFNSIHFHPSALIHVPTSTFNSLWPSDAIWRPRSGSTLAQVKVCCLTAPNRYMNQRWLIVSEVPAIAEISLKFTYLKFNSNLPGVKELNTALCSTTLRKAWQLPTQKIEQARIGNISLQWRHNEGDGVSNHQPSDCLLKRLFRRRPKKTSKLRITGLCEGNSPVTGEFPAQMASNAENVSIWWRHHVV